MGNANRTNGRKIAPRVKSLAPIGIEGIENGFCAQNYRFLPEKKMNMSIFFDFLNIRRRRRYWNNFKKNGLAQLRNNNAQNFGSYASLSLVTTGNGLDLRVFVRTNDAPRLNANQWERTTHKVL